MENIQVNEKLSDFIVTKQDIKNYQDNNDFKLQPSNKDFRNMIKNDRKTLNKLKAKKNRTDEEETQLTYTKAKLGLQEGMSDAEIVRNLVAQGTCENEKEAKERVARMSEEDKKDLIKGIQSKNQYNLLNDSLKESKDSKSNLSRAVEEFNGMTPKDAIDEIVDFIAFLYNDDEYEVDERVSDAIKRLQLLLKEMGVDESLKEDEEVKVVVDNKEKVSEDERDYNKDFEEFLDIIEFTLIKGEEADYINDYTDDGAWALVDLQGANLSDIEGDRFNTPYEIIDRLDVYINDYILEDDEWGSFDSLEEIANSEEHPLRGLADTLVNHYDDIDLEKVYNDLNPDGVSEPSGSSIYALNIYKKGTDELVHPINRKLPAYKCSKEIADKLQDMYSKYPQNAKYDYKIERIQYEDTQTYEIFSEDDAYDEYLKLKCEYEGIDNEE